MKNTFILPFIAFLAACSIGNAQKKQQISFKKDSSGKFEIITDLNEIKKFDTTKEIELKPDPQLSNISYELKDSEQKVRAGGTGQNAAKVFRIIALDKHEPLELDIKENGSVVYTVKDIGKEFSSVDGGTGDGGAGDGGTGDGGTGDGGAGDGGGVQVVNAASTSISSRNYFKDSDVSARFNSKNNRYNRNKNEAYFFFDEDGNLMGPAPVNIDGDDYLVIYLAAPKKRLGNYKIDVEGDYDASDLLIRPNEKISFPKAQSDGKPLEQEYDHITVEVGPFTTNATILIYYSQGGKKKQIGSRSIRINKLFNVAFGASFISTDLEKPSFDVFPISGTEDSTIKATNSGNRTLATFNVIFYWKPTVDWLSRKLGKRDNITQGRDILKEARFWERLNPTFGVSIDDDWRENFFFGATFEFARGGNLIAGWHYGKVQELVDDDFVLGESTFSGTKDDIRLTDVWDTGFFFGINLDTRIFNSILSRN